MTDTNASTLRNALAAAIKSHVTSNGLKAKDAAEAAGVQYSRLSQILRGDVAKISSDALVNVLGGFGYRLTGITGSGNGTEIVLSLDKAEAQVLPEIEKPIEYSAEQPEINHSYVGFTNSPKDPNCIVSGSVEFASPQAWGMDGNGNLSIVDADSDSDSDAGRVVNDDE